jgi:hypothetical protein
MNKISININKPKEPIKPTKPFKGNYKKFDQIFSGYETELGHVIKTLKAIDCDVDLDKVYIKIDDYYDKELHFTWHKEILNENYEKELIEYKTAQKQYKKDCKQYGLDYVKYLEVVESLKEDFKKKGIKVEIKMNKKEEAIQVAKDILLSAGCNSPSVCWAHEPIEDLVLENRIRVFKLGHKVSMIQVCKYCNCLYYDLNSELPITNGHLCNLELLDGYIR